MHDLAGGTSEFCGKTQELNCPAATFLCRRLAIADENAASGIAVARHFDKSDGQLLRADSEFLLQDLSDALGRPAFLLGAAAVQHGDLNVWHRALLCPADMPAKDDSMSCGSAPGGMR